MRKILQEQRRGPFGPDWEDPSLKRKADTEPEETPKKPKTDDVVAETDEPSRRVSQESSTTVTSTTTTSTSSSSSSSDDSSSSSSDDVKEKAEPVVEPDQKEELQFDPLKGILLFFYFLLVINTKTLLQITLSSLVCVWKHLLNAQCVSQNTISRITDLLIITLSQNFTRTWKNQRNFS